MTPARRLLGVSLLATGVLSLLLWIYVAYRIVTCDLEVCYIDWYSPFFGWFPLISFLETGLIAFVLSFVSIVLYLTFWGRGGKMESLRHLDAKLVSQGSSKNDGVKNRGLSSNSTSMASRFLRALLMMTGFYSLLLLSYLMVRLIVNDAPINSPFIDVMFPWFTFFRLSVLAFAIGLISLIAYLALFWRPDDRPVTKDFG